MLWIKRQASASMHGQNASATVITARTNQVRSEKGIVREFYFISRKIEITSLARLIYCENIWVERTALGFRPVS